MNLELMAMRFLRWQKRCCIVVCERSPREWTCGKPDVLGVTQSRCLLEIEVKRSLSDFKADFTKRSRNRAVRELIGDKLPKQFWYLVPCELLKKVEPLVPDWAGLMRGPGRNEPQAVSVVKPAPTNPEHQRLTVRECCRLVLMVNNHALSNAERYAALTETFEHGYSCWPNPDFQI